jgi:hypothetical protein
LADVQLRSPHMASLHFRVLRSTGSITSLRLAVPAATMRSATEAATASRFSSAEAGASA